MDKEINYGEIIPLSVYDPMRGEYILKWGNKHYKDDLYQNFRRVFKGKPSLEVCKEIIIDHYNNECQNEIKTGFVFKGHPVFLSEHNQTTYNAFCFTAIDSGEEFLPQRLKFGTDEEPYYYVFETLEDVRNFNKQMVRFILETLDKYRIIKDDIDWSLYE